MEDSVAIDDLAPESWESADVDESLRRLMLEDPEKDLKSTLKQPVRQSSAPCLLDSSFSSNEKYGVEEKFFFDDAVNGVDQFLREALQNPRERLSVLRLEQEVEKFIKDPHRLQMEFQQLPTSYLRLAAHRVAQHYSLQSTVLLDNVLPDGSRIIIRKTAEIKLPLIRLADIPLSYPSEENGNIKVAIKQRPRKKSNAFVNSNDGSSKGNNSKSVEERKEEYNKARARIFNSNNSDSKILDVPKPSSIMVKSEERDEPSTSTDPVGKYKMNNRVAIFRDREIEKKDPDYDRNYDRYVQRFDPGFGFNTGQYSVKPLYAPALNYNTEFPQLGSIPRRQGPSELIPRQHAPVQWANNAHGLGFNPDVMGPPNPNYGAPRSPGSVYMHSHYPLGVPYMHPPEYIQQYQPQQQKTDGSFDLARPR